MGDSVFFLAEGCIFTGFREEEKKRSFRPERPIGSRVNFWCREVWRERFFAENFIGKEEQTMLNKVFKGILAFVGALLGYEVFALGYMLLSTANTSGGPLLEEGARLWLQIFVAIISGIIFYNLAPALNRKSKKMADNIGNDLQTISTSDLLGAVVGLIAGLIIAFLLSQIYSGILTGTLHLTVTICIYVILGYVGLIIGNKKLPEMFAASINMRKLMAKAAAAEENPYEFNPKESKKKGMVIVEIMKTGFLEGPIVIPEFVLVELRHIADSSDALKRTRGRRGLDILNKIQEDYGIEIYNTDSEKALKEIPEVDVKLLKLAQIMKGKVVTNDFNLNKVAGIKGVPVLNINELANAMKPMVIPGEVMTVTLIKQGKEAGQAVAYLDDGTMIVVEDGRRKIGQTLEINVTSVLQTAAGRMIFGKVRN